MASTPLQTIEIKIYISYRFVPEPFPMDKKIITSTVIQMNFKNSDTAEAAPSQWHPTSTRVITGHHHCSHACKVTIAAKKKNIY